MALRCREEEKRALGQMLQSTLKTDAEKEAFLKAMQHRDKLLEYGARILFFKTTFPGHADGERRGVDQIGGLRRNLGLTGVLGVRRRHAPRHWKRNALVRKDGSEAHNSDRRPS